MYTVLIESERPLLPAHAVFHSATWAFDSGTALHLSPFNDPHPPPALVAELAGPAGGHGHGRLGVIEPAGVVTAE